MEDGAEGQDLRGALVEAYAKQKEIEAPPIAEPENVEPEDMSPAAVQQRARDEQGRFAKQAEKVEEIKPEPEVTAKVEPKADKPETSKVPAPPNGWSPEAKARWHELPPEIMQAVAQREQDLGRAAGKMDEERALGRDVSKVFQPYMPILQAEGATPLQAVQSLLNTAYVLRQGSPQQKKAAVLDVIRQYGIDITPDASQQNASANPELVALRQELAQLKGSLSNQELQAQSAVQAQIKQEIDAFAADPANAHYEEVKADMAALLSGGRAKDLKTAYDMACWARPEVRSSILAQQRAEDEQKRRDQEKQRADEARRRAVSVTGAPGSVAVGGKGGERSLRDELEANMAAARSAV